MLHLMKKQEGDSDDESNTLKKKITVNERNIYSSMSDRKVKVISDRPNTSILPHIKDEK